MGAWVRASCKKFLATYMAQKEEPQIRVGSGCYEGAERAGAAKLIYKERNKKKATEQGQEQDTGFGR